MKSSSIKFYFQAVSENLQSDYQAEKWLDNNSQALLNDVSTIEEAQFELAKAFPRKFKIQW